MNSLKVSAAILSGLLVGVINIVGLTFNNPEASANADITKDDISTLNVQDIPYIESPKDQTSEELKTSTDAEIGGEWNADDTQIEEIEYYETYYEPDYYYSDNSEYYNNSGLTASSGVNYYNGRKETYYSSNVLYHYRTPEWTAGDDGVYRDSDGYVVVAANCKEYSEGDIIESSFGPAKVYDSGCDYGTTDVYVNW